MEVDVVKSPAEYARDQRIATVARETLEKVRKFEAIDQHLRRALLLSGYAQPGRCQDEITAARAALRLHFDSFD